MKLPQLAAKHALQPPTVSFQGEPLPYPAFPDTLPAKSLLPECGGGNVGPKTCSCGGSGAATCNCNANPAFVYVIGSITPSFPSLSVEKEFLQAIEPSPQPPDPKSPVLPLSEAWYFQVLGKSSNFYLAREICWQLRKDAVTPYLLVPRSENELVGMISASAPTPATVLDFDVVLGRVGPPAPPEMCNGLALPVLVCDQSFDFTDAEYINAITGMLHSMKLPFPVDPALVRQVFFTVLRMSDNTGDTDEFRAMNFLAVRYLNVYVQTYLLLTNNFSPALADKYALSSVHVQPAPVQGTQKVEDVVFTFLGQATNTVSRWFVRVDVSGEFPFLLLGWTQYYGT